MEVVGLHHIILLNDTVRNLLSSQHPDGIISCSVLAREVMKQKGALEGKCLAFQDFKPFYQHGLVIPVPFLGKQMFIHFLQMKYRMNTLVHIFTAIPLQFSEISSRCITCKRHPIANNEDGIFHDTLLMSQVYQVKGQFQSSSPLISKHYNWEIF